MAANITRSMSLVPRMAILAAALLAVLAICAPALAAPAAQAQAKPRPNIVVIMTDDQTDESLKVMRNVRFGLRARGTIFSQAIVSFPLCCPSRATYLTGQYSHNNGVTHNVPPFGGYVGLDHSNTLPVWLQSAGYRTIHLGRYLNGYGTQNPDVTEVPPGWDEWHSTVDPYTFDLSSWKMNDNGVINNQPTSARPGEHQNDFMGRRGAELIDAAAPSAEPFFLSMTFAAPHSSRPKEPDDPPVLRTPYPAPRHRDAFADLPLPRPPNFNETFMRDKPQVVADRKPIAEDGARSIQENYQQELESLLSVDEAVASVLAALDRSGEAENTLVIYTADNGFFHGEHRIRSEKVAPYEPALRVPLVMRGPGVPQGRKVRQVVSNVDLAPTILEAAGALPGRLQDGVSLLPVLRDRTLELGREVVIENGNGANRIPRYRGIRNERFLYVRHETTGEYELYDLWKDPYELRNLDESERYDRVRRLLARRLRILDDCAGRTCLAGRPRVSLRLREVLPRRAGRRARSRPRARRLQACLSRDLRLGIFGGERRLVERVRYFRGDRSLGMRRRRPFTLDVRRRRLPGGSLMRIRARVVTIDGRVATRDRLLRTCARR